MDWQISETGTQNLYSVNVQDGRAEAQSQPFDLSTYDYDPSCPLPSNREARDRVIAKDPFQQTNGRLFFKK